MKWLKHLLASLVLILFIIAGVSADQYIGGKKAAEFTGPETVTCVTDAGTASVSIKTTLIVTDTGDTDEDTIALADGQPGQEKIFVYKTETDAGDSANVTPSNLAGGTKITFDVPGEGCVMVFDGTNWSIVANNGGTIS